MGPCSHAVVPGKLMPDPDWCHWTPEVLWKHTAAENPPHLCFLCCPWRALYLSSTLNPFKWVLVPSSTEPKLMCTINSQTRIGRTRSPLHVLLAGKESSVFSKAICKQHGAGREFRAVGNAQPALRAVHANTKCGVTTSWEAWETVLLYLHLYQKHLLNASFRCSRHKAVQNTPTDTLTGILNSSASLQPLNSAGVWKQEESLLCLFFQTVLFFFPPTYKFPQYLHLSKLGGTLGNNCCHYGTCRFLLCSFCSSTFLLLGRTS